MPFARVRLQSAIGNTLWDLLKPHTLAVVVDDERIRFPANRLRISHAYT